MMRDKEWLALLLTFTNLKRLILIGIAEGGTQKEAAVYAGCGSKTIYNYVHGDPEFASAYEIAKERAVLVFEGVLDVCAKKAATDPRYVTALIFLLKSRYRSRYGDYQTVEKKNAEPLQIILEDEKNVA